MKATPPPALPANRNAVLAAVFRRPFFGSLTSPQPLRVLCHVIVKGADTSYEYYLRVWERLCAAAAILLEGEARFTSRLRTLSERYRGSQRPPIYEPSPTHKTLPVAL